MKKTTFSIIACVTIVILSCNNSSDRRSDTTNDSLPGNINDTTVNDSTQKLWDGRFSYLFMEKKDVKKLLRKDPETGNKKKKIVFQFRGIPGISSPLLIAYGARKIDVFMEPHINLIQDDRSLTLPGEKIFGDLELPKRVYKKMLEQEGADQYTHMSFKPIKIGNHVSYEIVLVILEMNTIEKKFVIRRTFVEPETLNPSPPRRPCGVGLDCDDDDDPDVD